MTLPATTERVIRNTSESVNRRFMLLPLVVGGFLMQHALQGWCPPVPILRRLGVRTCREIDLEREALRNLQQPPVTL